MGLRGLVLDDLYPYPYRVVTSQLPYIVDIFYSPNNYTNTLKMKTARFFETTINLFCTLQKRSRL
jgi:hypothetical protein